MRELSKVARSTRRPAKVLWKSQNEMVLASYPINVDQYFLRGRQLLEDTEKHFREKVLMGIDVDWYQMQSTGNSDFDTRGAGPFTDPADENGDVPLQNVDSKRFTDQIAEIGHLCQVQDGVLHWDTKHCLEWFTHINIAVSNIYIASHNFTLPGRGSEEMKWSPTNTAETRCHITQIKGTLGFLSNYHKGAFIAGIYKEILRLLPYRLARIVAIFWRLVRPVETVAFSKSMSLSDMANDQLRALYGSRIFASYGRQWDKDKATELLKAWFKDNLGVPIGINLHRHLAQALQRKFLKYGEKASNLSKAANEILGHGDEAGEMNYAVEEGSNLPISREELFVTVCSDYISLFGVAVYPPDS